MTYDDIEKRQAKLTRQRLYYQIPENKERSRSNKTSWSLVNPEKRMLQVVKNHSKRRGIECSIELSDLTIPAVCPVFGTPLVSGIGKGKRSDASPSVDRIDNTKGYIKGNVRVISWRANRLKNDATLAELELLILDCKKQAKEAHKEHNSTFSL